MKRYPVISLDSVVHADVLEYLHSLPPCSVHLVVTSPPYNIGIDYDQHDDSIDYDKYLDWIYMVWKECKRVLVDGGRIAINVSTVELSNFRPLHYDIREQMKRLGMTMRAEVIWNKGYRASKTAW